MVDQTGKVVGIVTSGLTRLVEELPQNVNFALKAAYVRTLLADLPDLGGYAGEWSVAPGESAADRVQGDREAIIGLSQALRATEAPLLSIWY